MLIEAFFAFAGLVSRNPLANSMAVEGLQSSFEGWAEDGLFRASCGTSNACW